MVAFKAWWKQLSQRESILIICGAIVVGLAILFLGIIQPMKDNLEHSQQQLRVQQKLWSWMSEQADKIHALGGSSSQNHGEALLPINQAVSESAGRYKIELIRMQPKDEALQVWINPVAFNTLMSWISELQESQQIKVDFLNLSLSDSPGLVEVSRLQFNRGG